jgi:hypothetical protein
LGRQTVDPKNKNRTKNRPGHQATERFYNDVDMGASPILHTLAMPLLSRCAEGAMSRHAIRHIEIDWLEVFDNKKT